MEEEPNHQIRIPLLSKDCKKDEDYCTYRSSTSSPPSKSESVSQSPVEQVALTVPTTDDPSLPVLTFRMWVLGILSCTLLSFLNQFFWYRTEPLLITAISAQIAVVPLGQLMASKLTDRLFFQGTRLEFTMNPGPFNVKEHVLITIFANSGAGMVYAIHLVTVVKVFYKNNIGFFVSVVVIVTTQVMGFGWAGFFRRFLVEPAAMWWPSNLVQVSLFRALHEKEKRRRGGLTRTQFFLIAFICSFAYYVFPGYLFQVLTSFSWICWIFPKSILAQQLGSGLYGLGVGAIGLDWSTVSSYIGSPLVSPWFATANIAAGYFIFMFILTPIFYWLNIYKAKTFPIFSRNLFKSNGQTYNIPAIIDSNFHIDMVAYEKEGPLYLSVSYAITNGAGFASLAALIVHVALFHGRELREQSRSSFQEKTIDIHTKLMRGYKQVPEWWFMVILLPSIAASLFASQKFNDQLQLPWWGLLLACAIGFFFTLPMGIITAITNQAPPLTTITQYIIGYIYPGYPVANMLFRVYGSISTVQAITFLHDFKLGHYMKIPPRTMFMAQMFGTLIATIVYLGTAWWLMETIPDLCEDPSSIWTCPTDTVFYNGSVIWGLIGPQRIFGDLGTYSAINWFFLIGAIAPVPVWLASKVFPKQDWIRLVNMPVLIATMAAMPPATAVNMSTWIIVGFLSGFVVYRYKPDWWRRHNYVLSGALDAGLAFMAVLLYCGLGLEGVGLHWWGNELDGCPLASCPTAKGVVVEGCPVHH